MRIYYTYCPVCGSTKLRPVLQVKDHTVSGEVFPVVACRSCTLRFTQDVPDALSMAPYYKSEKYISHTNTSKGLINRLYHLVRKRTLAGKRKLVTRVARLSKGKLLDVGSGTGAFLQEMNRSGWQTTGLEPDVDARKVARETYGITLFDTSHLYQLPAASFDAITLWHVLEHVHELETTIRQLKVLLKDTGTLVIAVPNYTTYDETVYKEYWAAYDVPRHLYHFSPRSMDVLLQQHGLAVVEYKPMWYDSFYISMLSSKYKNGKTNWIGACWNGLVSNLKAFNDPVKCSSVTYIIQKAARDQL